MFKVNLPYFEAVHPRFLSMEIKIREKMLLLAKAEKKTAFPQGTHSRKKTAFS
ncbi:hypothetical protein [Weizmannia acidilactici]|uniref:hypothetical protein n=1 Tax=Weizmannia acidilactici TaxID=2607726 RepID=UPI0015624A67|nr:hypothetical protein [Weizmannia acidilactici]